MHRPTLNWQYKNGFRAVLKFLKIHKIDKSSNQSDAPEMQEMMLDASHIVNLFIDIRGIHFKDVCGKKTEHTDGLSLWIKHEGRATQDAKITFGSQRRFAMSQTAKAKITPGLKCPGISFGHLGWRGPPFGPISSPEAVNLFNSHQKSGIVVPQMRACVVLQGFLWALSFLEHPKLSFLTGTEIFQLAWQTSLHYQCDVTSDGFHCSPAANMKSARYMRGMCMNPWSSYTWSS